jgi:hypothetical protein
MANKIKFNYQDKAYTLEYTRASAVAIEKQGFSIEGLKTMPNMMIPLLVNGAFLVHHRRENEATINAIYKNITNKEEFISKLVEMYAETTSSLLEEPDSNNEGNISWENC